MTNETKSIHKDKTTVTVNETVSSHTKYTLFESPHIFFSITFRV